MTNQQRQQRATVPRWRSIAPLRRLRRLGALGEHRGGKDGPSIFGLRAFLARHRRLIRRTAIVMGACSGLVILGFVALWWRLAEGPIPLDVVTPWLASAIEENFGSNRRVEVGGTQIERTNSGATAVRIRDIVVRDADGTIVASAPKAEVRVSGMSLLAGHLRAESLNLVGAEMAVRIEQDGSVTVFAGADKHPIASAAVPVAAAAALLRSAREKREPQAAAAVTAPPAIASPANVQSAPARRARDVFAALLSWIDGIGETGLDGHGLRELGLKNGNLTVDDARTGKHWKFQDISLSVERARGGVEVTVGSDNPVQPWGLTAAVTPTRQGYRQIQLEARRVSARDLLLASRLDDGNLQIDLPLSASMSGEIGPDGLPQVFTGRILAEAGSIASADDPDTRIDVERAEFKLSWDAENRILTVPFQVLSDGNRITLLAQVQAPAETGGDWSFKLGGGTVVLNSTGSAGEPLVLNRIAVSGHYDAGTQRLVIDEGDIGNTGVGVAMSGNMDFSGSNVRLAAGVAGTRMSVEAAKRLWPPFIATKVRNWFDERVTGGTVERIVIAVNAPLNTLRESGPPVPDDSLSIDVLGSGCIIRPVDGLPALRDADVSVHIAGRNAMVSVGKATSDLPSGRRLAVSAGAFEVPDTAVHPPQARVHFKVDGPIPVAAELLRMGPLVDVVDMPVDPAAVRGAISAQVALAMPIQAKPPAGSTNYAVSVDITNFSAERMILRQKVEAALLKASATPQGFQIKGDVRIAGAPANLEYRKMRGDADADVRISGTLDEAARSNLGLDVGNAVVGAIPIRLGGRVATASDREGRFTVEADLTPVQIDGLLPGWAKPAGKPARATFTLTTKPQSSRIEDLLIEGAGNGVRGAAEFDGSGDVQSANFPSYGFSDGDRATLKIERTGEGALRVVMRGDVYDGRSFVKSIVGGAPAGQNSKRRSIDVDLDMKLGAVVGFNGEALRGVELRMARHAGEVRSFGLSAKIGRDAVLTGGLRARAGARPAVDLESTDAGALFRFTDVYTRMTGGQASIAMDPPSADNAVQQGVLNVRNFSIHDETQLERAVGSGQQARRNTNAIDFSGMRVAFTRMPGRIGLRDGVVRGPILGGTIDGVVNYAADEVLMRGTLIPLYGPNNLLGQIPLVGLFMGGDKEGLFGLTYEVVGRPGNPELRINPISALAPGLLRKVFEFPVGDTGADTTGTGLAQPR